MISKSIALILNPQSKKTDTAPRDRLYSGYEKSEKKKEHKMNIRLIALVQVHYYPAKTTPHIHLWQRKEILSLISNDVGKEIHFALSLEI